MSKKTNTKMQALRIGSRVRCTDDGVEGRITWANAVSVKIKWDDGEEVTWRRDTLASKPIEFLDDEGAGEDDQTAVTVAAEEQTAPVELSPAGTLSEAIPLIGDTEIPVAELTPEQPQALATEPAPLAPEQTASMAETPTAEPATAQEPPPAPSDSNSDAPTPATAEKPKRQRKTPAEPKEKKVSARDAAARVLAEEGRPMTCQEMIEAMAARGYWTSPTGATPAATLYSALLRELSTKADAARFVKTERGKFALRRVV
jgi:hypothetical protein